MKTRFSKDVGEALRQKKPVVALESTVIAHGLPFPQNLETALRMEDAVRTEGAVPATIAVLKGEICIGLDETEIRHLATAEKIHKVSKRDLPIAVAEKLDCATTVAATSFLAYAAGIRVFATGGIGGVHRGYDRDISADLPILAQTPIAVVCSGAKIVLDLPATREWLETFGIPVLGWQCDEMPAFYSRKSGLPVDWRIEEASAAVAVIAARDELALSSSVLITTPVPEQFEIERERLDQMLSEALQLADERHIAGKEITPFLLSQMSIASNGETVAANIALLINNAGIAAKIARSLA